jgi:sarcosine oxidase, subunit gamma
MAEIATRIHPLEGRAADNGVSSNPPAPPATRISLRAPAASLAALVEGSGADAARKAQGTSASKAAATRSGSGRTNGW